ncbi:MAG: CpaF family protein [Actinomycetota bacterium]|nr:CpaF family protein [Actinomycetota bacterium]
MKANLDELKKSIRMRLVEELGAEITAPDRPVDPDRARNILTNFIASERTPLSAADKLQLSEDILDDVLGYGPIEKYLKDPEVTEIMINGPDTVYIERFGLIEETDTCFINDQQLRRVIDKIVSRIGRRIDESTPMVDARLPDGSRVNVIIPPLALDGAVMTIRKFSADPLTVEDLVRFGTLTEPTVEFLRACVRGRLNIIVSGGTGTGKTTTLNVLSSFIPASDRVVTIEDAAELQLKQKHVIRLESRPANIEGRGQVTIRELLRNALRMRPDRIVVGEARGGEAFDMLQAMNTGHDGSLSTVHCNSPRDALARVETMVLMAGLELPPRAIREQISSALDLIIHLARLGDGSRRVTQISEVQGLENEIITMQDIFTFDFSMGIDETGRYLGRLKGTGIRPQFMAKLAEHAIELPAEVFAYEQPEPVRQQ